MDTVQTLDADATTAVGSNVRQYLTFLLQDAEYGVDILRVREIKGWDTVTPLPNTPEYLRGVMNLRGTIVPIIDLRQRFSLERVAYGPSATSRSFCLVFVTRFGSHPSQIDVENLSDDFNVTLY